MFYNKIKKIFVLLFMVLMCISPLVARERVDLEIDEIIVYALNNQHPEYIFSIFTKYGKDKYLDAVNKAANLGGLGPELHKLMIDLATLERFELHIEKYDKITKKFDGAIKYSNNSILDSMDEWGYVHGKLEGKIFYIDSYSKIKKYIFSFDDEYEHNLAYSKNANEKFKIYQNNSELSGYEIYIASGIDINHKINDVSIGSFGLERKTLNKISKFLSNPIYDASDFGGLCDSIDSNTEFEKAINYLIANGYISNQTGDILKIKSKCKYLLIIENEKSLDKYSEFWGYVDFCKNSFSDNDMVWGYTFAKNYVKGLKVDGKYYIYEVGKPSLDPPTLKYKFRKFKRNDFSEIIPEIKIKTANGKETPIICYISKDMLKKLNDLL